jgi:hypothetical protein
MAIHACPLFASPKNAINSVVTSLREPPHELNHYDSDMTKRRIARSTYKCELSPSSLDQGICNKHDEKPEL